MLDIIIMYNQFGNVSRIIRWEKWVYSILLLINLAGYSFLAFRYSNCGQDPLPANACEINNIYWMFGLFLLDCLFFIFAILIFLAIKLALINPVEPHHTVSYNRLQKILMTVPILLYITFMWGFFTINRAVWVVSDIMLVSFILTLGIVAYYFTLSIMLEPTVVPIEPATKDIKTE